jgi:hypothetical protein
MVEGSKMVPLPYKESKVVEGASWLVPLLYLFRINTPQKELDDVL